jgi:hypothetical protein
VRYGVERFLYRMGRSRWRSQYVVKGATLFDAWLDRPHRPTRDLDVSRDEAVTRAQLESQVREICAVDCPEDGLAFDLPGLTIEPIRRAQEGQGLRARFLARLGQARIHLQLDVGFGDVVTPAAIVEDFPTLLELPAPRVKLYPRETFIAEKVESMVRFGRMNTRYKDFSDVALLSRYMEFRASSLREACRNTFENRGTPLVPRDHPEALRPSFYSDGVRRRNWAAFARENPSVESLGTFPSVGEIVAGFLGPVWDALGTKSEWNATWGPNGPWSSLPSPLPERLD